MVIPVTRAERLAIAIPAALVLGPMPFLIRATGTILGLPPSVFWLFCCIPLTSLCLFVASRGSE